MGSLSATDLFFDSGHDLYAYNGSGSPHQLGGAGLDPRHLVSFAFGGYGGVTAQTDLIFNGADATNAHNAGPDGGTGGRGLYIVTDSSSGLAVSEIAGTQGLNPQDITILDGVAYFAAADTGNPTGGEGLWEYNPLGRAGHQLMEVFKSSLYNLDVNSAFLGQTLNGGSLVNPQPQIVASGGELYFAAINVSTNTSELFAFTPTTNHVSAANYNNAYNLTATNV